MRKVFMAVLAAALITLPILAEQEKPTAAPADRPIVSWNTPTKTNTPVGPVPPTLTRTKFVETTPTRTPTKKNPDITPTTPTPTRVANGSINLNSSRSNRVVATVTPGSSREVALGGPDTAARGQPTKEQRQMTGRVLSQQGRRFTVLSNGKEFTFSAGKLKTLPKVGETIDITYTQTPGGPMEATTINTTRSNTF